jgi:hypothetical protein
MDTATNHALDELVADGILIRHDAGFRLGRLAACSAFLVGTARPSAFSSDLAD